MEIEKETLPSDIPRVYYVYTDENNIRRMCIVLIPKDIQIHPDIPTPIPDRWILVDWNKVFIQAFGFSFPINEKSVIEWNTQVLIQYEKHFILEKGDTVIHLPEMKAFPDRIVCLDQDIKVNPYEDVICTLPYIDEFGDVYSCSEEDIPDRKGPISFYLVSDNGQVQYSIQNYATEESGHKEVCKIESKGPLAIQQIDTWVDAIILMCKLHGKWYNFKGYKDVSIICSK